MRRAAAAGLAALVLAGCAPYPIPPSAPASPAPAPEPASAPGRQAPPPPVSVRDPCGAEPLQGLVGRPRSEIPVPLDPNRQRVACTRCPVTQDYDPGRLNFLFDAESGLIRQIRCG